MATIFSESTDNWQKRRKELTATIYFLSDFLLFWQRNKNLSSIIAKHFLLFFLKLFSNVWRTVPPGRKGNNNWFFPGTLSAINSKIECNKNCAEPTATFSLTYEVRGSLRRDRQSDSIPSLGRIIKYSFKTFKYPAIAVWITEVLKTIQQPLPSEL